MLFDTPEARGLLANRQRRTPCVLLLDTSTSMAGEKIQRLNAGFAAFREDILRSPVASQSVELCVISFGPVRLRSDFAPVQELGDLTFATEGATPMKEALELAMLKVTERKQVYAAHGISSYRPWIFLLTVRHDTAAPRASPWVLGGPSLLSHQSPLHATDAPRRAPPGSPLGKGCAGRDAPVGVRLLRLEASMLTVTAALRSSQEDPGSLVESCQKALLWILRSHQGRSIPPCWIDGPDGEEEITLLEEEVLPAMARFL